MLIELAEPSWTGGERTLLEPLRPTPSTCTK